MASLSIKAVNAYLIAEEIGWGGRIRTFTGLINSEVPYQLDHAPAASAAEMAARHKVSSAAKRGGEGW